MQKTWMGSEMTSANIDISPQVQENVNVDQAKMSTQNFLLNI